jgi:hypothetical protein
MGTKMTMPIITAFRAFNPDGTTAWISWTVSGDESPDSFELEYEDQGENYGNDNHLAE